MTFVRFAMAVSIFAGAIGTGSMAQAYIGQGVHGRPHGGHAVQRYFNWRHGYGYTAHPRLYRR